MSFSNNSQNLDTHLGTMLIGIPLTIEKTMEKFQKKILRLLTSSYALLFMSSSKAFVAKTMSDSALDKLNNRLSKDGCSIFEFR